MSTETVIIQLVTALISAFAFGLLFGMKPRFLMPAALGGMLTWGVYLLAAHYIDGDFMPCFIAAAYAIVYAEFLARMLKTPATLFVLPAVIPLVPGSFLYYAMSGAVRGDTASAAAFGTRTLVTALAIAAGLSVVTAVRELCGKSQPQSSGKAGGSSENERRPG